jgi:hypothetical protein
MGMSEIRQSVTVLFDSDSVVTGIVPLNGLQEFGSVGVFEAREDFSLGGRRVMKLVDSGGRLATHGWKFYYYLMRCDEGFYKSRRIDKL